ncbi:MAG: hypothetical protein HGA47_12520 [Zoogloea sp.]|nr:hypothetical protein [Zoogloea sp.]
MQHRSGYAPHGRLQRVFGGLAGSGADCGRLAWWRVLMLLCNKESRQTRRTFIHPPHRSTEMPQGQQSSRNAQERISASSFNVAAIAVRGMGQLYDMQLAAARMMLQTEARAAVAFGFPDYSDLFKVADDRAKRVFTSGTEHLLSTAQQANETLSDVQRQVGRLLECNAVNLSENWQRSLDEFGEQAEEGLSQLREMARRQVEEAVQATEALSEATRESMREGTDQMRESMREGTEQMRESMQEGTGRGGNGGMRAEGGRIRGEAGQEGTSGTEGEEESATQGEKGSRKGRTS